MIDAVEKRRSRARMSGRSGARVKPEAGWWLLDYVDVVVHVFGDEERAYYDLERLWSDAPRVDGSTSDAPTGAG